MKIPQLPPSALVRFIHLQPISLHGVAAVHRGGTPIDRGMALVFDFGESGCPLEGNHLLLRVSSSLIVSQQTVEEAAKADRLLHDALRSAGTLAHTPRGAAMVFLLVRTAAAAGAIPTAAAPTTVRDGWCEYVRFLPAEVLLPTAYTPAERRLLTGTSLEAAVAAKMRALTAEFETMAAAAAMPWLELDDWIRADALYRSRSLALPGHGHALVPVLDFANHAQPANACFGVTSDGEAILSLRPSSVLDLRGGQEVTIDYSGAEESKGAAEMAFSYGFLPESLATAREMVLPLASPAGGDDDDDYDPLARAKQAVFGDAPRIVRISETAPAASTAGGEGKGGDGGLGGSLEWESPYAFLSVVNEEDGLSFRVLQQTGGERTLQAVFRDKPFPPHSMREVLLKAEAEAEAETEGAGMWEVFLLRVVVLLQNTVERHLRRLLAVKGELELEGGEDGQGGAGGGEYRPQPLAVIMRLRELEETMLLRAVDMLAKQQARLLQHPTVQRYLSKQRQQQPEEEEDGRGEGEGEKATRGYIVEDDGNEVDLS